jgi:membrane-bound inhibitor of C-type lysozyme
MMMKVIWAVVVVLIVGGAAYYIYMGPGSYDYVYACAEGGDLSVRIDTDNDKAFIHSDSAGIEDEELDLEVSASGARFTNGKYTYWSKGDEATVYDASGTILSDCVVQ